MTTPKHYRFLLDFVEEKATSTPAIMFGDTESFWDDLLEAYDRRKEKHSFWLFGTRWMREHLIEVMNQGTPRALAAILAALNPHQLYNASWQEVKEDDQTKRRIIAFLLPILMSEMVHRVGRRSKIHYGEGFVDDTSMHPEDS
jgi:hypothetical protein